MSRRCIGKGKKILPYATQKTPLLNFVDVVFCLPPFFRRCSIKDLTNPLAFHGRKMKRWKSQMTCIWPRKRTTRQHLCFKRCNKKTNKNQNGSQNKLASDHVIGCQAGFRFIFDLICCMTIWSPGVHVDLGKEGHRRPRQLSLSFIA